MIIQQFEKVCNDWDTDQVYMVEFSALLNMLTTVLKHLGKALAIAFTDIKTKADQMLDNQNLFVKKL